MTGNKSTYWCLCTDIYGETIGEPIDVKIDSSGTIETLKMKVWEKTPQLQSVSFEILSNCLFVRQLSSFGRTKFATIGPVQRQDLISQANREEVKSNDELLTMLFCSRSGPQDKYIHFLIQFQFGIQNLPPPLSEYKLWCLRIDADGKIIGEPFQVKIESSKTISALKEKVWDETPEFKVISANRLVVWKLNELSVNDFNQKPPHIPQSRISQAKGDKALSFKKLSAFFDKKSPQKELIHFVIEHPSANYSKQDKDPFMPLKPLQKNLYFNSSERGSASSSSNMTSVITHALLQSGFEIFSLEEEFELMTELPDHIVRAESADGTSVVAKLVRKDSQLKELHILQMFSRMKSTLNHTIPLLDTIPSSLGSLLIIPYKTTLSEGAMFYESFRQISTRLSQELIEGVAFLHKHKVAHLDIKPNNIVYSLGSKRLYIIDFNLSMCCKDIEEMVTKSCGTVGWSAPEVELDENKPLRAFSPIRADLWSCGKVLQFILERSGETKGSFSKVIDKLMDDEPKCRPLLHEIVDDKADFWVSNRLLEGVEKQVQVQCNAHRVMTIHGHKGLKRSRNIADFDKEVNLGSPSPDSVDDSNSSESGSSSGLNTPTLSTTTTTPPHILDQSLSDQLSTKIRNKLLILNNVLNTEEQ